MKRFYLCTIVFILYFIPTISAEITIYGNQFPVITETPVATTGLNNIYILHDTDGVSISYTASSTESRPVWMSFDSRGGGFASTIDNITYSGNVSTLAQLQGDCGYIIEDGSTRIYFWVVDYSQHQLELENLSVSPESDCTSIKLDFTGAAEPIYYTTINGRQAELSREIKLSYNSLVYDADQKNFIYNDVETTLAHISQSVYAEQPLTDTSFRLSGDRFLELWGDPQQIETPLFKAVAVEAHADAEQILRENDNEQSAGTAGSLGGSAPAEVEFTAAVTDAVVFKEWQISRDSEFDIITYRDNNLVFNHTFREDGTFYVRFAAANAAGSCSYYSPTFDVTIGESDIKCPNAFSPGNSDGVNDLWKVSYKSIISFECHIFNRWGQQMCSFTNPADGWDGKYKGKLVPSGVYYYVIKAKGADGRKYNLKGDINIINHDRSRSGNTPQH